MDDIVQFYRITSKEYKVADDNLKVNNKIFFLSDTNELYIGSECITSPIEWVEEFPSEEENYISKKIYININTLEGKIYINNTWHTIIFPIKNDIDVLNTYCPVSGFAVYNYLENNYINSYNFQNYMNSKKDVSNKVSIIQNPLILEDNTEYRLTEAGVLSLQYPDEDFEIWMSVSFVSSGDINIIFPEITKFIGSEPSFKNSETWEISIKDGVAICWRVS